MPVWECFFRFTKILFGKYRVNKQSLHTRKPQHAKNDDDNNDWISWSSRICAQNKFIQEKQLKKRFRCKNQI